MKSVQSTRATKVAKVTKAAKPSKPAATSKHKLGWIGMGRMGRSNLSVAMKQDNLQVAAVCDVYQPHLEQAVEMTAKQPGGAARGIRDFREILADKSIRAVVIETTLADSARAAAASGL